MFLLSGSFRCMFSSNLLVSALWTPTTHEQMKLLKTPIYDVYMIWYIYICIWAKLGVIIPKNEGFHVYRFPCQGDICLHISMTWKSQWSLKPQPYYNRGAATQEAAGVAWSERTLNAGCQPASKKKHSHIWMFQKIVGFPPKSSILIGISIINRPLYIANWVIIWYLPPIKGTRKLHWYRVEPYP